MQQQQQITAPQLKKLNFIISKLNLQGQKAALVNIASKERTQSSKELTKLEAIWLIGTLDKLFNKNRLTNEPMIRKIFALAYDAEIIYGDSEDDKKMNTAKLNQFVKEKGTVKKELKEMDSAELLKTINQFKQIVKHKTESEATKATKNLMQELNLESSFKQRLKTH